MIQCTHSFHFLELRKCLFLERPDRRKISHKVLNCAKYNDVLPQKSMCSISFLISRHCIGSIAAGKTHSAFVDGTFSGSISAMGRRGGGRGGEGNTTVV